MNFDLLLKGGTCVLPEGGELKTVQANVGVTDGKIAEIGSLQGAQAAKIIDVSGLHVLPGLIDSQVHFREPGAEHKENLASGTRGAIKGGITTIFEMPNTNPSTTSALDLNDKLTRANGRCWSDFAFFLGATAENADRLSELESLPGCCGIKIFMGSSTGNLLVADEENLRRALKSGHRRMAIHCEDEERLKQRRHIVEEKPGHVELHPTWRDEEAALLATQKIVRLAEETGRPVHVLHITTAQEMEFLSAHKKLASVECTPQHLTLYAPDCYERLGTFAQMNPPIRTRDHQQALWRAVNDGTVDVIGSDHAPHTKEEKAKIYPDSPSGMPGVQTTVPLMLNHVNEGRLRLERFVAMMSLNPARLYGLKNKGEIRKGFDADFTVVDLKRENEITTAWMETRSGWTPFDGMKVQGWPVITILRGQVVMRDDQILGSPLGLPAQF